MKKRRQRYDEDTGAFDYSGGGGLYADYPSDSFCAFWREASGAGEGTLFGKDSDVFSADHGLPEFLAVLLTALLHIWRRNVLLSIAAGTLCYMFLVQIVFVSR